MKVLEVEVGRWRRYKIPLSVMILDIDFFKQINDNYGHKVGDQILNIISTQMTDLTRNTDIVSRWGGDEFVILLTALNASQDALRVADKIRDEVLKPITLEGTAVTVSASMGVALYPQDGHSKAELLERADLAMYQAKSSGRNNIKFYQHDLSTAANHTLMMAAALRKASSNR